MIAASPRNPRHIICKRVLGLEGDTVRVPVASSHGARTVTARTPFLCHRKECCCTARVWLVHEAMRLFRRFVLAVTF